MVVTILMIKVVVVTMAVTMMIVVKIYWCLYVYVYVYVYIIENYMATSLSKSCNIIYKVFPFDLSKLHLTATYPPLYFCHC